MQYIPNILFWIMICFVVYKCEMRKDLRIKHSTEKCAIQLDEDATTPNNIVGSY